VPLFLDREGKLDEVQQIAFGHEREPQDITERNLKEIFGLNFVKREFSIGQLRIDTLAYDEQMQSFVIIEYKKDRNSSVIDQG
jgi:RecB family endonuclease NucS